jgi:hypothetical protein
MRVRRALGAACVAAALAAAASGQAATKKYDWRPDNGAQDIDVQDGKVVVSQVVWDMGGVMKGTPLRKSSANVRVRIDNNGNQDAEVGVAVVVFDAEGNVVAAGSNGTKWGFLNKGDRTYYSIDFPYVYRRLDQAANFLVTLETRVKGAGKSGSAKWKSSSSSTSSSTVETEPIPTPVPH